MKPSAMSAARSFRLTMDEHPLAILMRIEAKLDILISALAEDDGDEPLLTLDGQPIGGERDQGSPL
jgi:hypothetical protein